MKHLPKAIGIGIVLLLMVTQSTGIGDWIVGLYAIAAIILALDARWSFGLALLFLVAIPLLQLLGQKTLGESYAVFAYFFLVIGVITSLAELRHQSSEPEPVSEPVPAPKPALERPAPPPQERRPSGMAGDISRRPRPPIKK